MSEMKLIMENWRGYRANILSEVLGQDCSGPIETVGCLRKAITSVRNLDAAGDIAKTGLKTALGQIPGINNVISILDGVKDTREALIKLYGTDDQFTQQAGLDKLSIDPNVSKIVDNKIENAFLNYLLDKLDAANEYDDIPDINQELQGFLTRHFDQHSVRR